MLPESHFIEWEEDIKIQTWNKPKQRNLQVIDIQNFLENW